jgi:sterol desaturase/sphingolipid hydroxylase (fatty acid hydroxylase superfamily)
VDGDPTWLEYLADHEMVTRFAVFLGVFVLLGTLETIAPRRRNSLSRWLRWTSNVAILGIGNGLLRLVFPVVSVGMALIAEARGWGLFNVLHAPAAIAFLVSVVLLDLAIYVQHVAFHAVPTLWRLHRVHHADIEFDVSTGVRFHPIEILLSMLFKLVVVVALGPPVIAVLLFELVLNVSSMFNHSNVRIPAGVDRVLRRLVVTPDMHRVHHSIDRRETNSNFGFNLPWWDRLFGTYLAQPRAGHETMTIGIERFRTTRDLRLDRMLIQPWLGPADGNSLERTNSSDD